MNDLIRLDRWKRSNPTAPDGKWFKDLGSFKVAGEGPYASTFLTSDQVPYGEEID